ncbi:MAG: hypothetical protein WBC93_15540 [Sulfitobacter sp.]
MGSYDPVVGDTDRYYHEMARADHILEVAQNEWEHASIESDYNFAQTYIFPTLEGVKLDPIAMYLLKADTEVESHRVTKSEFEIIRLLRAAREDAFDLNVDEIATAGGNHE